jgi:hypothetical protein
MCDWAGHRSNITYSTTNVPGGRVFLINLMLLLLRYLCFFVDLIDTTASARDPSCFSFFVSSYAFYLFPFAFVLQLGTGQKCASLSSFFDSIFYFIFGIFCAAEQALINGL